MRSCKQMPHTSLRSPLQKNVFFFFFLGGFEVGLKLLCLMSATHLQKKRKSQRPPRERCKNRAPTIAVMVMAGLLPVGLGLLELLAAVQEVS